MLYSWYSAVPLYVDIDCLNAPAEASALMLFIIVHERAIRVDGDSSAGSVGVMQKRQPAALLRLG
jgi:hypothetical protein